MKPTWNLDRLYLHGEHPDARLARLVRSDPHLIGDLAEALSERSGFIWDDQSPFERQVWRDRVIDRLEAFQLAATVLTVEEA